MTRVGVRGVVILALVAAGCAGKGAEEKESTGARPMTPAAVPARGCVSESAGPWTSECSAWWVRRIVRRAGYRVTAATGTAWVASGRGREFFIWATEPHGSVERSAKREGYRPVARIAGASVYDDGVRRFWPAGRFTVWLAAGPHGDSVAPRVGELAPLVRASRTIPPPRDGHP